MAKDIKQTLKEGTKDILSEEALDEIQAAFTAAVDEKAGLQLEAALTKQDEEHADKVGQLLEAIDKDHTDKLDRIVEAVTENHTQKLKMVIERYQGETGQNASVFKEGLVDSVSNYLDLYLEKTFPQDMLEEAVQNKRSENVLAEVRKILAVDMALAKDEIKDAVVDGKKRIDEATTKLDEVEVENTKLLSELNTLKAEKTLSDLSTTLPEHKKKYVQKVLGTKSADFITENFDYTLELFDKETAKNEEVLKEEAIQQTQGTVDSVIEPVVVEESAEESQEEGGKQFNSYMNELGKY